MKNIYLTNVGCSGLCVLNAFFNGCVVVVILIEAQRNPPTCRNSPINLNTWCLL